MIEFDKPFTFNKVWADYHLVETHLELQSNHVGAAIGFSTKKGEQVHAKVASSFISPEQAELNLKEIGNKTFEQTKEAGRKAWNDVLGRIKVEDDDENRMRTFYSCLYRSVLFPRMFHEVNAKGETVHYSPYNGEIRPGYNVYRYRFLGYVPLPVPVCQFDISFNGREDAGRTVEYIS